MQLFFLSVWEREHFIAEVNVNEAKAEGFLTCKDASVLSSHQRWI